MHVSDQDSLDYAEWAMLVKELEWIRKEEAKKHSPRDTRRQGKACVQKQKSPSALLRLPLWGGDDLLSHKLMQYHRRCGA